MGDRQLCGATICGGVSACDGRPEGADRMRYDYDEWCVYELIDPRNHGVFYIGKSSAPRSRLSYHKTNPESAAYGRIREIRSAGFEVEQYVIGRFNTEIEAFDYEGYLIRKTPGLVNRLGYYGPTDEFVRPAVNIPEPRRISTENQPIPDEDTIVDAIAVELPTVSTAIIRAVIQAKSRLFDVDFEYAGVTDE